MKKITIITLSLAALVFSGCCYSKSKILIQKEDLLSSNMTLSYEGSSIFYQELRGALAERGIKVLKYNVQFSKITEEEKDKTETGETRRQVEGITNIVKNSRYLLSVNGSTKTDVTCLTTLSQIDVHKVIVEITDLETNEVVFSIKAEGLPEPCGYCRETIYENIADKIYKLLKTERGNIKDR